MISDKIESNPSDYLISSNIVNPTSTNHVPLSADESILNNMNPTTTLLSESKHDQLLN